MSADVDTARAFLERWQAQPPAVNGLIPGGIASDQLHETQPIRGGDERPAPYARLECAADSKPREYVSGGEWVEYVAVKLLIYGVGKDAIGGVLTRVAAAFDNQDLDYGFSPETVAHMRTEPLSAQTKQAAGQRQGEDWREGVLTWRVWLHRRNAT